MLIKSPEVLERSRRIDTVVFDKTGTLTTGRMHLAEIIPSDGEHLDALLARASSVEASSEHPIAAAIVRGARERGTAIPAAREFTSSSGRGASAIVDNKPVRVGRRNYVTERDSRSASSSTNTHWQRNVAGKRSCSSPGKARFAARWRSATPSSPVRRKPSADSTRWGWKSR